MGSSARACEILVSCAEVYLPALSQMCRPEDAFLLQIGRVHELRRKAGEKRGWVHLGGTRRRVGGEVRAVFLAREVAAGSVAVALCSAGRIMQSTGMQAQGVEGVVVGELHWGMGRARWSMVSDGD